MQRTPLLRQFSKLLPLRPTSILQKPFPPSPSTTSASFSTTTPKMTFDTIPFKAATELRRSIYPLSNTSTISDARIKELVEATILNTPSSFNSQSTRLVVLVKEEHEKFWDIVTEVLKGMLPEEQFEKSSKGRMAMFRAAYGTALFYEDRAVIKGLQDKMSQFAEHFPQWSEHTSAMHQYVLWTALEAEGLGANLQHYNPIANEKVAKAFNIQDGWELKAQLVFGDPAGSARNDLKVRDTQPLEERIKFVGF